ncbi:MAG: HAD-IIIA family hydrolase [Nitrospinae bacterium]|nr:HAD-IIIA family hydrolase [Nitrospinota bacterium]
MDEALFRAINSVSGHAWDTVMVTASSTSTWSAPAGLLAAGLLIRDRRRGLWAIAAAVIAVGIGDALGFYVLKELAARARPCFALENVRILIGCGEAYSFPSNHAINSLAIAGAIGYFFRPMLWALVPAGLLVSLSRVAVGAHYPSDVAAGAVIGFIIGWIVSTMIERKTAGIRCAATKLRIVFLDRDGCVNVEDNHIRDIAQFRLYPDTLEAIRKLNSAGFKVVVITNQSGVARGLMTEELVRQTHDLLMKWTREAGVTIDRIEYCPHHPEGSVADYAKTCDCRKPMPGMLIRAAKELGADLPESYVVGDKISDIELGPATGAKAILVRTGYGARDEGKIISGEVRPPAFVADGIKEAVDWILADAGLRK